ncbi:MAG: relaxase/mobilization nuclease domain-containing protein [Leptotrichia wadei]|uniref:Relaxase/mobilization nuclease domain protein n=1 Tax=Streptococcus vestibularis F0396 TaxID=904306 RepID=E3CQH0_STRVE|nr:SAG1250 family conjugative relaxase [Leptotrichia wadei]EFQ59324.1 relaxase/mobilization nuclease domain protein [Streptococcus vestibularis F0396]MDU4480872.1 SAG1250 family conjugative relaxase [Streptococcus vestibularis]MDU7552467.1 SAG1250 family conjugative relaxase [Streptococcus parasanguinis]MBS6020124.1 relaxase/mobilization nuclease domain-containing protein [Leptotrichia wadei]MDU6560788.1 SAG1250 family conjugative relaxase [Streptococcus vestibularis]
MVVTKHFATHGKKYRRRLIKYILNPDKTDNLKLVSDFGMSNYLDFPSYEEMVEMYNVNFTNNDKLYESRNDRQEKHQQNIHAHHLIQSFSPEDNLTPEEINRIGYETMMELTGGRFRFIVATHTDKDHVHNHILINAIDRNSDKKLIWNYALERNLRMISDRISKMAGAKIIEKRYSYRDYQKYRQSSHKFELKQRLYFLMQQSKSFDDFLEKAVQLHVYIDFSQKHSRFMMTDRAMTKPIRGRQLNRREPYDEDYFRKAFAKAAIEQRLQFLLPRVKTLQDLLEQAKELGLAIQLKQKNVTFTLTENNHTISLGHQEVSKKALYDVSFFHDYFSERSDADIELSDNIKEDFEALLVEQSEKLSKVESIVSDYQTFSKNRKAVHEFEVELAPHQVDKEVEDGIFIKVAFGVKKEGLIFIPNYQLDEIENGEEKRFKVHLRETSSYFIYHKESSDKNRYMKGRALIRQLTQDSKSLPYRRRPNLKELQDKIAEVNLLIELNITGRDYTDIKDELVAEIATYDVTISELNDKTATLNKMAEVLINLKSHDSERRRLARYEFSKLNLTDSVTLEQIEREISNNQDQLSQLLDHYEEAVRKLETFVAVLNRTAPRTRVDYDKGLD